MDAVFTLYELKQALEGVNHTSPGKEEVCYEMIKHVSDNGLNVILRLYNEIWRQGRLPSSWKLGIVVLIAKPEKEHSTVPTNYRSKALISNLCKIMERVILRLLCLLCFGN